MGCFHHDVGYRAAEHVLGSSVLILVGVVVPL